MKRNIAKGLLLLVVIGGVALAGGTIGSRSEAQAQQKTLGSLLVELENAVLWSAVDGGFRNRQQGWRQECMAAHAGPEFARLLAEFESWVLWSAVDTKWKARRTSWIKDVRSAGAKNSAGALGKLLAELESNILWSAVDAANWKNRRSSWLSDCKSAPL